MVANFFNLCKSNNSNKQIVYVNNATYLFPTNITEYNLFGMCEGNKKAKIRKDIEEGALRSVMKNSKYG